MLRREKIHVFSARCPFVRNGVCHVKAHAVGCVNSALPRDISYYYIQYRLLMIPLIVRITGLSV